MPELSSTDRELLLRPPTAPVRLVIDTDTYNEIDDQFALVHALLSPERLQIEAIYAAPFHNSRSSSPGDGMQRSYEEIVRLLDFLGRPSDGFVFSGATEWLPEGEPELSAASTDLIRRARASEGAPLYVLAIGAITNVAAALRAAPDIAGKIVLVWLAGHPSSWYTAREFNLSQDLRASRLIFDSGVPLVWVPCVNVAEHLRTTQAEMERFVKGRGAVGDYLFKIYSEYYDDHFARSKHLWDVAPVGWLLNPEWVRTVLEHSPLLTSEHTWSHDPRRHFVREAIAINRDAILGDLFRKLEQAA